jgi:MYXO-CTERM domain-containing protein
MGNGTDGTNWLMLGLLGAAGVGGYFLIRSRRREEEYAELARRGWVENEGEDEGVGEERKPSRKRYRVRKIERAGEWIARPRKASGTGEDPFPKYAPDEVKTVFRLLMQAAHKKRRFGEGPHSIHWAHDKGEWAIGDNFDRVGFLVLKPDGRWYYRLGIGRDRLLKKGSQNKFARMFFKKIEEYMM